jgi:hypothetical protein
VKKHTVKKPYSAVKNWTSKNIAEEKPCSEKLNFQKNTTRRKKQTVKNWTLNNCCTFQNMKVCKKSNGAQLRRT